MASRLTDVNIWKNQRWFRKLDPNYKLVWHYLKDNCNHAGLWKISVPDLIEDTGVNDDFDFDDFIKKCNTDFGAKNGAKIEKIRLLIIADDVLFLTGFITFQYGKNGLVSPKNNWAKPAIQILKDIGIYERCIAEKWIVLDKKEDLFTAENSHQTLISDVKQATPSEQGSNTVGTPSEQGSNTVGTPFLISDVNEGTPFEHSPNPPNKDKDKNKDKNTLLLNQSSQKLLNAAAKENSEILKTQKAAAAAIKKMKKNFSEEEILQQSNFIALKFENVEIKNLNALVIEWMTRFENEKKTKMVKTIQNGEFTVKNEIEYTSVS